MSDGAISQDEIDALLSGVDLGGMGSAAQSSSSMRKVDTKPLEEFSAGTVDKLQNSLNTMTGVEFSVAAPAVEVLTRDDLLKRLPEMVVGVTADFTEGMTGDHLFLLSPEFAKKLAGLINKEEITELDDMSLSVISEIVSQYSGAEITALSQTGKFPGLACAPAEAMHVAKAMVRYPQQEFVLVSFTVKHESEEYVLWEAISNSVAFTVSNALNPTHDAPAAAPQQPAQPQMNMGMMGGGAMDAGAGMPMGDMNPMMGGMNPMMGGMSMGQMPGGMPNVQPLQYPNLQSGISSMEQGNISLIMDVFMEMTVELGRTKKQIKEILGMGEGTIIELDKLAGEPVDILVNHKPIAKGEVVVIDENFGVRVTEILSPIERVSGIK
ncbi:MAG: flagellar motor switch protein FliN [Spirochaetaceae bacterium]|nr:flagellar motor switch protein FliN [Spirochaetaceae bacterium]MBO7485210.1 flagellar motor switch protein FliN [Spirochaetaceae bacterium]